MSDVTTIVAGLDYAATLAAATFIAHQLLKLLRPEDTAAARSPEPVAHALNGTRPRPLPPLTAQRQEAYDQVRADGKTAPEAAAALGITAPSTARDYEARYQAAVSGGTA